MVVARIWSVRIIMMMAVADGGNSSDDKNIIPLGSGAHDAHPDRASCSTILSKLAVKVLRATSGAYFHDSVRLSS
jgi:hypothetical protein